jgi:hypothetical protein
MIPFKPQLAGVARYLGNLHVKGSKPDIFLLSTPRSGSTWLMEAIAAEPGIRPCNEPLNLRKPEVVRRLGISSWSDLQSPAAQPAVERYLRRLARGGIGYAFKTPHPRQRGYHAYTNRVIFKLLFGCEDSINWLRSTFQAQIVGLIRHPIPVSISREQLPRLSALMAADYFHRLPARVQASARRIADRGDALELAQLDWCLQNKPLLESRTQLDLLVTYEQLVLQPEVVAGALISTFDLTRGDKVRESMDRLSGSVSKSSRESLAALENRGSDATALLAKWRRQVDPDTEHRLMKVLEELDIDIYRAGQLLPDPAYWLGPGYPSDPCTRRSR